MKNILENGILPLFDKKNGVPLRKDNDDSLLASDYSANIRTKIQNILDQSSYDYFYFGEKETKNKKQKYEVILGKGTPKGRRETTGLLVYKSGYSGNSNLLFQRKGKAEERGLSEESVYLRTIAVFLGALREIGKRFYVYNVGKVNLTDEQYKELEKQLKSSYQKRSFLYAFDKQYAKTGSTVYKNFNPANSNAFLSGFLGELGNYFSLTASSLKEEDVLITGSAYDEIKGSGAYTSQSVSDIKAKIGEKTFGFNIKNYVTKGESQSITIYNSKDGFDIFNDIAKKYYTLEDLAKIRFLVLNYNYMYEDNGKQFQIALGQKSLENFSNFIRIEAVGVDTKNLFFILNNICYPSSYIYTQMIEQLNQEVKKEKTLATIQKFFSFSMKLNNPLTFQSDDDAIDLQNLDENNMVKSNSILLNADSSYAKLFNKNFSFRVIPKGLSVNLVNFSKSKFRK